jgi:magnesium-transporting ATPase (P-type)
MRAASPSPARARQRAESGLTAVEIEHQRRVDGPNSLPVVKPPSPVRLLVAQLTHFFAAMLWVAAGLAWVAGLPQLAVAIAVVVVLNGVFAFAQEWRADRAGARLQALLPVRVTVVRDSIQQVIPAEDLVRGDIVLLNAGDRVCADLTVLRRDALAIDESMLTGESVPATPDVGGTAFAGTYVVEGTGRARVVKTGGHTRLAEIAALSRSAGHPKSPLSVELDRVVRIVALISVAVGIVFFGIALLLGTSARDGFLFAVGVTVALVPEGLLPTVTLSLARGAQQIAQSKALVRRLESVETLGSTTFICTDKTGTLTRNEMSVVEVWTPTGIVFVQGEGYGPKARFDGREDSIALMRIAAASAFQCINGRAVQEDGTWRAHGDPMDAGLHALAMRCRAAKAPEPERRFPFDPRRRRSSAISDSTVHVIGAPDAVLPRCGSDTTEESMAAAEQAVEDMTRRGLRVIAVARRVVGMDAITMTTTPDEVETRLELLAVFGLQDPPRPDVAGSLAECRAAGISVAMVTGDHPGTAAAIADQVGLSKPGAPVLTGEELPTDDTELATLLDCDGIVIARVTPEDKLRICRALQSRGHVVAMTGDGVNDGPALRTADIGVAMGLTGTDVAREAADLVLLDDRFETIVESVRLGRATYTNIRRFLTYHLTDNVAELTPFVVWALTAGTFPLAIGVLQVLALDIGTDLLPALALGAEPPAPNVMNGPMRKQHLMSRPVLKRVFGVLGPVEAAAEMAAFTLVLVAGGWRWGETPGAALLATASGTAFTTVVLGQLANAFACRSVSRPVYRLDLTANRLLLYAVGFELSVLAVLLYLPGAAHLLGGDPPSFLGWLLALMAIPLVVLADAAGKWQRARKLNPSR